jgi:predicted nucleotidyltransferase
MKTMTLEFILKYLQIINDAYKDKGFKLVGVFGSYARHEESMISDIDIAYSIDHTLFFKNDAFAKLEEIEKIRNKLEKVFKRKVDLVSLQSNNISFIDNIKKEIISV